MMATLLNAALAASMALGAPAETSANLPATAWSSRMIMSFTPEGELNACRLENDGALKQPAAADVDCMESNMAVRAPRQAPVATTNLIFEERFVPGIAGAAQLTEPVGDQLLSRVFMRVEIGADGKVRRCRTVEVSGTLDVSGDDPCASFDADFDRPAGRDGLVGTMIVSVYLRAEVIA
jgi:hypothetical protein